MTGIDPGEAAKPGPDPDGGIDLTEDEFQAFRAAVRGERPRYEIREHEDDPDFPLDEVVAHHPVLVHLERMSRTGWWLGIDMPDGTHVAVNLGTVHDRAKPYGLVEVDP